MSLYVGKFAGGGHEDRISSCAETQVIGGAPLRVIGADEVMATVREVARNAQYCDNPVLKTLKVLEATGSLVN